MRRHLTEGFQIYDVFATVVFAALLLVIIVDDLA